MPLRIRLSKIRLFSKIYKELASSAMKEVNKRWKSVVCTLTEGRKLSSKRRAQTSVKVKLAAFPHENGVNWGSNEIIDVSGNSITLIRELKSRESSKRRKMGKLSFIVNEK